MRRSNNQTDSGKSRAKSCKNRQIINNNNINNSSINNKIQEDLDSKYNLNIIKVKKKAPNIKIKNRKQTPLIHFIL